MAVPDDETAGLIAETSDKSGWRFYAGESKNGVAFIKGTGRESESGMYKKTRIRFIATGSEAKKQAFC